jgi:hypothetical protein
MFSYLNTFNKCAAAAGDFLKVLKDNVDVVGDVGCIRSMYPYISTCVCVVRPSLTKSRRCVPVVSGITTGVKFE